MTIWKFKLGMADKQQVLMPAGAQILAVQTQNDMPVLWALCNPHGPETQRLIAICGTGNPAPENSTGYIGTFQMARGSLVFHVFEFLKGKNDEQEQ